MGLLVRENFMNDIKISIVIPVYNVEKYLQECVDSVVKQSYKNIEIILVDDGSKCFFFCVTINLIFQVLISCIFFQKFLIF